MRTKRRPWWISCSIYVRRRRKTMGKTPIEWSQMTWNPIVGCSIASSGCAGCDAVPFAWRFMHHPNEAIAEKYEDTVRRTTAGQLVWTGRINFDEEALLAPLKRKLPTTWFVNSLSDLFHEDLAFEIVDRIIAVMAMTPHHRYQILTKRADRMAEYYDGNWRERVSKIVNEWPEEQILSGNEFLADIRLMREKFLRNVALGVSRSEEHTSELQSLMSISYAVFCLK